MRIGSFRRAQVRADGRHRAVRRPDRGLLLRRFTSVVTSFAIVGGGMVAAAPVAEASIPPCSAQLDVLRPVCGDATVVQTVENEADLVVHCLTAPDTLCTGTEQLVTALALSVQGGALPWWRQHKFIGRHEIAAYGYYTSGGGGLKLADPLNETWAGYHNLSAAQTYAAMSGDGNQMVW